jgi:predicted nucleic acid-binding protein
MACVLVDTNVLVYAHDPAGQSKHHQAIATLEAVRRIGAGRLSVQCLSEFFWTVTRGRRPLLSGRDAAAQVGRLTAGWITFDLTAPIVMEAVRGVQQYRLAFWDARLWATARLNQVPLILSEDFIDGRRVEGVRFANPFAPHFDLDRLLVQA